MSERFPADELESTVCQLLIDWRYSSSDHLQRRRVGASADQAQSDTSCGFIQSQESNSFHEQLTAVRTLVDQVILDETDLIVRVRSRSVREIWSTARLDSMFSNTIDLTAPITQYPCLKGKKRIFVGAVRQPCARRQID